MDFPAGHENPNLTIPFGTEIELVVEENRGWISYKEDALVDPSEARQSSS
jgi:muramoyltetrapeptide carboxypeptidase LdcA involved in peptidoglycan recycling